MSHLPNDHEDEFREYLSIVQSNIEMIESGNSHNYFVRDPDWLSPTIGGPNLSGGMDELTYYTMIREALNIGLEKIIVPDKYAPVLIRSPPKVRGLLKHDFPNRIT